MIPPYKGDCLQYKTLKENSLIIEGGKLYHNLPKDIRDFNGKFEHFKLILERFLGLLPDKPHMDKELIPAATNMGMKPSSAIKHWIQTLRLHNFGLTYEEKKMEEYCAEKDDHTSSDLYDNDQMHYFT